MPGRIFSRVGERNFRTWCGPETFALSVHLVSRESAYSEPLTYENTTLAVLLRMTTKNSSKNERRVMYRLYRLYPANRRNVELGACDSLLSFAARPKRPPYESANHRFVKSPKLAKVSDHFFSPTRKAKNPKIQKHNESLAGERRRLQIHLHEQL